MTKDPTCTEDGYSRYYCQDCGDSQIQDVVPATGHNVEAVVTPPGCATDGYTTHICTGCGESTVDTPVAATGHSFGEWYVKEEPTRREDGWEKRSCDCGEMEMRRIPKTGGMDPIVIIVIVAVGVAGLAACTVLLVRLRKKRT